MKIIGIGSDNGIRSLRRVDAQTFEEAVVVYKQWMKDNSMELLKWESLNELTDYGDFSNNIPKIKELNKK